MPSSRAWVVVAAIMGCTPATAQTTNDVDLSALRIVEATLPVPAAIGLLTETIGAANETVPTRTESKTTDSDTTKDNVREVSQTTVKTTYTLGGGRVVADVVVTIRVKATRASTGAAIEQRPCLANRVELRHANRARSRNRDMHVASVTLRA